MSDGQGIKAGIGQFAQDVGEALVEPVKDQVGQAIEEGVTAVASTPKPPPQDPQVLRQQQADQVKRQQEDAAKLQEAQQTIARYEKIEEEIAQVRLQKKQEEETKEQEEQVEKQEEMQDLQEKNQKSADITALERAERKTESKSGVGG
ncbi:MAG: hypothetical protein PHQ59_05145 [Candidatus Daviesbacteria bacterium]|nr:hypothetical protein [Candidatus Daviesbacteria bacterium]